MSPLSKAITVLLVASLLPFVLSFFLSNLAFRADVYNPSSNPALHELNPPLSLDVRLWQVFQHYRNPKEDFGIEYEKVEFNVTPNEKIRGWFVPAYDDKNQLSTKALVLVHGAFVDRREFLRHTPWLHEAGYSLLLIDCREHGSSDGTARGISLTVREHQDVLAAARFLRTVKGMTRVGVQGSSQGAASVVLAAGTDKDGLIDLVISEAPFGNRYRVLRASAEAAMRKGWGGNKKISEEGLLGKVAALAFTSERLTNLILETTVGFALYRMGAFSSPLDILHPWDQKSKIVPDPEDVVMNISPRPVLFLHSTHDQIVFIKESLGMYEKARDPKEHVVFEEGTHGDILNASPEKYKTVVLDFLAKNL